jgi:hypothetical protein
LTHTHTHTRNRQNPDRQIGKTQGVLLRWKDET